MAEFDEVQWQTEIGYDVGFSSTGGPQRQTQVVMMNSGSEARNARWTNSRRSWQIVAGKFSLNTGFKVIQFWEARNAQLIGWRFQDPIDWMSCLPGDYLNPGVPKFNDQIIGMGDGVTRTFQIVKNYTSGPRTWVRNIYKPQANTVLCGVAGVQQNSGSYSVNTIMGTITFVSAPPYGDLVTAGYKFDNGVRFNTDKIDYDFSDPAACLIQNLPIIELPEAELAAGPS